MAGYNDIVKIRRLEHEVEQLGMRMGHAKNGYYSKEYGDVVALFPRDQELPLYARDAELFTGTLDQLEVWLRAIEWARSYDHLLRISDPAKRLRKEQDLRNKQLLEEIKKAGQTEQETV